MRKLATAALAFSAAIFLANYCIPIGWLKALAALFAGAAVTLALLHRKCLRPVILAICFFAAGLTEYAVYHHFTVEKAESFDGKILEVTGTILDYPDVYDSYCRLQIRIDGGQLYNKKVIVYDYDKTLVNAEPGLKIRFTGQSRNAGTLYGKPYDNYYVNGMFYKFTIRGSVETLGTHSSLRHFPVKIQHWLLNRVDTVFPEDTRSFLKALMLGEKKEFYEDDALYISMSRAGLMHVVAVSGLHITFLVSLLLFFMGNGKTGSLTSILVVWIFVLVTGSGKAAVRAAFMQSLLLAAPLLRRENDAVTSLATVLALILAQCPLAAKSVSLQLSFGAMAGILCFFRRIYHALISKQREGMLGKAFTYVSAVMASSLSVMLFTIPLTVIHFGYVPLLSFLANIVCLWAVSACFSLAWISCATSLVPFFGAIPAGICALLVRYIKAVTGIIAGIPDSVLYLQTEGSLAWIAVCYVLLLFAVFFRGKKLIRCVLPTAFSLCLLGLILYRADQKYRMQDIITVLNVGQGQCITAFSGESTFMIDCGNSYNLDNAGETAGEYLISCGRERINVLMLTHLHADHANGVVRLLEMIPVEILILPKESDDPNGLGEKIRASAEKHGTEIVVLDSDAEVERERLSMKVYHLSGSKQENERCLMAMLQVGETDMLVTADSPQRLERQLAKQEDLSGTEILIVGHHGARDACSKEILREAGGKLAVISVGYNTYGHPAEETLERLNHFGYTVMRTDLDGNVEIALGE